MRYKITILFVVFSYGLKAHIDAFEDFVYVFQEDRLPKKIAIPYIYDDINCLNYQFFIKNIQI